MEAQGGNTYPDRPRVAVGAIVFKEGRILLVQRGKGALNLLVATIVSAVSGYAASAWLLRYLMRRTTMVFVWYRIAFGLLLALALFRGWIDP